MPQSAMLCSSPIKLKQHLPSSCTGSTPTDFRLGQVEAPCITRGRKRKLFAGQEGSGGDMHGMEPATVEDDGGWSGRRVSLSPTLSVMSISPLVHDLLDSDQEDFETDFRRTPMKQCMMEEMAVKRDSLEAATCKLALKLEFAESPESSQKSDAELMSPKDVKADSAEMPDASNNEAAQNRLCPEPSTSLQMCLPVFAGPQFNPSAKVIKVSCQDQEELGQDTSRHVCGSGSPPCSNPVVSVGLENQERKSFDQRARKEATEGGDRSKAQASIQAPQQVMTLVTKARAKVAAKVKAAAMARRHASSTAWIEGLHCPERPQDVAVESAIAEAPWSTEVSDQGGLQRTHNKNLQQDQTVVLESEQRRQHPRKRRLALVSTDDELLASRDGRSSKGKVHQLGMVARLGMKEEHASPDPKRPFHFGYKNDRVLGAAKMELPEGACQAFVEPLESPEPGNLAAADMELEVGEQRSDLAGAVESLPSKQLEDLAARRTEVETSQHEAAGVGDSRHLQESPLRRRTSKHTLTMPRRAMRALSRGRLFFSRWVPVEPATPLADWSDSEDPL